MTGAAVGVGQVTCPRQLQSVPLGHALSQSPFSAPSRPESGPRLAIGYSRAQLVWQMKSNPPEHRARQNWFSRTAGTDAIWRTNVHDESDARHARQGSGASASGNTGGPPKYAS